MFRSRFIPSIIVWLAVLLAGPASAQTISGLVAAYGFEEGSGTAVGDASGSNNSGVASGTTWSTAGKFGNALVFNGTSSQVTIPDAPSLRLTTAMTLEAWVFPTTAPTGWRAIVDKNVDGYYLFASTDNGNRPAGGGTWTSGNQNTFGLSPIPVNAWTHLATTFDGATVRLFVNGVQVASQAQTAALAPTTATLQIGADAYPTEHFAGMIDEVRVYNRALSAAEIQADMGVAVGAPPPPVLDTVAPSAPGALTPRPRARLRSISPGARPPTTSASPAIAWSAARARGAPRSHRSQRRRPRASATPGSPRARATATACAPTTPRAISVATRTSPRLPRRRRTPRRPAHRRRCRPPRRAPRRSISPGRPRPTTSA